MDPSEGNPNEIERGKNPPKRATKRTMAEVDRAEAGSSGNQNEQVCSLIRTRSRENLNVIPPEFDETSGPARKTVRGAGKGRRGVGGTRRRGVGRTRTRGGGIIRYEPLSITVTRGRGRPKSYQPNLGSIREQRENSQTFNEAFTEDLEDEEGEENELTPSGHSTRIEAPLQEVVTQPINPIINPRVNQTVEQTVNQTVDRTSNRSISRNAELNRSLPTNMIGGLLGLSEDQMNDPYMWTQVIEAIKLNRVLADQVREKTLGGSQLQTVNNPDPVSVREAIPPTQEMPQDRVEQFVAEIRQQREENRSETRSRQNPSTASQGTIGNRENERETVLPSLAACGPVVRETLHGRDRSEEPLETAESVEINEHFPEVGLALAGCAVRFAPRGAKSKIPRHSELPTHSGFPPTDLLEFLQKLADYAIAGGYSEEEFMAHVVPGSLRDTAKNWWVLKKGFKDWDTFTHELVKAFLPLEYAELMKQELGKRYQDVDEPLLAYIQAIELFYRIVEPNATEAVKVKRIKANLNRKFSKVLLGVPFSSVMGMVNKAPIYEAAVGEFKRHWQRPPPPEEMLQSALGWKSSKPRDEGQSGKGKGKFHPSSDHQKKSGQDGQGKSSTKNPNWQHKKVAPSDPKVDPNTKNPKIEEKKPVLTGGNKEPVNKPQASSSGQQREKLNPLGPDGKPRWTHCFNCREEGHFARNCPKSPQANPSAKGSKNYEVAVRNPPRTQLLLGYGLWRGWK